MNNFGAELYEQLAGSAEAAGLKIISDDWACKLLAWLFAFGGGNEAVVFNDKLYRDIKIAQKRLKMEGGETPNVELLPTLQGYLKEVAPFLTDPVDKQGNDKKFIAPEWIREICEYYELSLTQTGLEPKQNRTHKVRKY